MVIGSRYIAAYYGIQRCIIRGKGSISSFAVTEELKTKHGIKDVLIGLKPTGHHWRKIAYFAKDQGYAVRFIRTTSLARWMRGQI